MMNTYKVTYQCKDGIRMYFMMDSDKVLTSRMNFNSNPLFREVLTNLYAKKDDPNSKMNAHGGLECLRRIESIKGRRFIDFDF